MGSGHYDYISSATRSATYAKMDYHTRAERVFSKRELDKDMDIKNKIRESCDSDEHPNSFPVIIALDVTGSMGNIPHELVSGGFPEIMKKIMDNGCNDVQVCFMGVGDHECDEAPIQVGQFETSDELTEKWLTKIYIEGGGGGNAGESYLLPWYVAARHTKIDSFDKRGIKGVLITIGDEPTLKSIPADVSKELFGDGQGCLVSELLEEVSERWNVYHINVKDYSGSRTRTIDTWRDLLGNNCICTQTSNGSDIPEIIAGIVTSCYTSKEYEQPNVEITTPKVDNLYNSTSTDYTHII